MYPDLMQMRVNTPQVAMNRFVNFQTCIRDILAELLAETRKDYP
jgi:hypothetical protein